MRTSPCPVESVASVAIASHAIAQQIAPGLYRPSPMIETESLDLEHRRALASVDTSPERLALFPTLTTEERRRIVCALHVRDGLSQLEVARAVGVHPSTIGRQLERAGVFKPRQPRADVGQSRRRKRVVLSPKELEAADRVAEELRHLPRPARRRVLQWSHGVLADADERTHTTA